MKATILLLFYLITINIHSQHKDLDNFFDQTDIFMNMYVQDGLVNYKNINTNKVQLNKLIDFISNTNLDNISDVNYKKSFLINTYNLLVIKEVIKNYPVTSPMTIGGFFKNIKHIVGGKKITLNELENNIIRKTYNDPRIHFVLVCGAISCPPIINNAYKPNILNNQLDTQTKIALNNPNFIRVNNTNKKVGISEIFKWYPNDFKDSKNNSFIEFINQYRENKIRSDFKHNYYSYDWSLNTLNEKGIETTKSNILAFSPSKLMQKGKWDLKMFNNLYTQTRYADKDGKEFTKQDRASFFTTSLEFYTGISKNARINVGTIFNIKSNRGNNESPFNVFKFKTEELNGSAISRAGLSSIGLSVKISPFKKVSNFSFQSSFFIPVFDDEPTTFYLDRRSYVWETRFYYDYTFLQDKFQFFGEVDVAYIFGELSDSASAGENSGERFANNSFGVPVSLFLSYFPTSKFTVYINGQHYQLLSTRETGFTQDFTFAGLGVKYQLTKDLNIELSTTRFLRGKNTGLGETYNLGLRYIL